MYITGARSDRMKCCRTTKSLIRAFDERARADGNNDDDGTARQRHGRASFETASQQHTRPEISENLGLVCEWCVCANNIEKQ